jgi:hypothetical protein
MRAAVESTPALAGDLQNFHRATQGCGVPALHPFSISQTPVHYSGRGIGCQDAIENHSQLKRDNLVHGVHLLFSEAGMRTTQKMPWAKKPRFVNSTKQKAAAVQSKVPTRTAALSPSLPHSKRYGH